VDIFRVRRERKIVEHWDVIQDVPASSANDNTMFWSEKVRELRRRLPELAVEPSTREEFRSARTADIRADIAAEFFPEYSDGYRTPAKLAKELAGLANNTRLSGGQVGGLFWHVRLRGASGGVASGELRGVIPGVRE
jgi:hypothetical protein